MRHVSSLFGAGDQPDPEWCSCQIGFLSSEIPCPPSRLLIDWQIHQTLRLQSALMMTEHVWRLLSDYLDNTNTLGTFWSFYSSGKCGIIAKASAAASVTAYSEVALVSVWSSQWPLSETACTYTTSEQDPTVSC